MGPTLPLSAGTTEGRFFCNALALSTDERKRYGELAKTLRPPSPRRANASAAWRFESSWIA